MDDLAKKLKDDEIYNHLMSTLVIAEEERNVALSRSRIAFIKRDRFTWVMFAEIYYNACKDVIERSRAVDSYVKIAWEVDNDSRITSEGTTEDQGRTAP